jgi:hypothetical protein
MPYGPVVSDEDRARYTIQFYTTQNDGVAYLDITLAGEMAGEFGYDELFQEVVDKVASIPSLILLSGVGGTKSWDNRQSITPTP